MPVKKVKSLAPSVPSSLQGDLFAPGVPGRVRPEGPRVPEMAEEHA